MSRRFYFITHPDVVIQPEVPIPEWPLSALGRARMQRGLAQPWVRDIASIHASTERKAVEAARILADHLALPLQRVSELGENDRSSTGYLPRAEFEATADAFFAHPGQSVRGWERAIDAQTRIVASVQRVAAEDRTTGAVAIVSHGAVGALLYCHLNGSGIDRLYDQPANGGGNFFRFNPDGGEPPSGWWAIDVPASAPRACGNGPPQH
jgi:broad specificity phosphatase PhoE